MPHGRPRCHTATRRPRSVPMTQTIPKSMSLVLVCLSAVGPLFVPGAHARTHARLECTEPGLPSGLWPTRPSAGSLLGATKQREQPFCPPPPPPPPPQQKWFWTGNGPPPPPRPQHTLCTLAACWHMANKVPTYRPCATSVLEFSCSNTTVFHCYYVPRHKSFMGAPLFAAAAATATALSTAAPDALIWLAWWAKVGYARLLTSKHSTTPQWCPEPILSANQATLNGAFLRPCRPVLSLPILPSRVQPALNGSPRTLQPHE